MSQQQPYGTEPTQIQYGGPQQSTYLTGQPGQPQYGSPQGYYGGVPPQSTNPWAIAALVLGLMGGAILPVIAGHLALSQIKRTGQQGAGLAIAGLVLGYLAILAYVVLFLVFGGFVLAASRQ